MKKRALIILLHCVAWFAFLSVPYLFKPDHPGFEKSHSEILTEHSNGSHFQRVPGGREGVVQDILLPPRLANGFLFVAIFYINYLVVIPQFYRKRSYWPLVGSLIASIGLLFLINFLMQPAHVRYNSTFTILGPSHNLFVFIIVIVFSFMLSFHEHMRKMEKEKLADELLFLKAQINPHFLFNTLNSIYSLSLTRSDKTPDAIVKLSSLFRYCVTDAGKDRVSLEKELVYVSDYIALQRLRLTDKVDFKYEVSGDPIGYEITPFVLIPFIENAFKYGVNSQENSSIYISINIQAETLKMLVSNNKLYVEKDDSINSGLGISDTTRRLQHLYPGKHVLDINDKNGVFNVSLIINLK